MEFVRNDGATLGIGTIPGRKKIALYRMHGCRIDPVAYFDTEGNAQWVADFLESMAERKI